MKILSRELEPTGGNVSVDPNERVAKLNQDQFAYEQYTVIDTVIMGHKELWEVKQERDRIYSLPEMSEEDGMRVADLEVEFAEMDGYMAESKAGELLLAVGIPVEQHYGLMSQVAPAGNCVFCWLRFCLQTLILCCLTNRRTTWISTRFAGWKIR